MRPSDSFGRPRAADDDDTASSFRPPPAPQMTYFLADEAAADASLEQSLPSPHRPRESRKSPSSEKPESEPDISHHTAENDGSNAGDPVSTEGQMMAQGDSRPATPSAKSATGTPASLAQAAVSQPMTPILLGTSESAYGLSGSSSRRNSLEGSLFGGFGSGAVSTAGEARLEPSSSAMMDSGSAPQLIMPSIKMPSRRPFTEEGKAMGRLKILLAGDSGKPCPLSVVHPCLSDVPWQLTEAPQESERRP